MEKITFFVAETERPYVKVKVPNAGKFDFLGQAAIRPPHAVLEVKTLKTLRQNLT